MTDPWQEHFINQPWQNQRLICAAMEALWLKRRRDARIWMCIFFFNVGAAFTGEHTRIMMLLSAGSMILCLGGWHYEHSRARNAEIMVKTMRAIIQEKIRSL